MPNTADIRDSSSSSNDDAAGQSGNLTSRPDVVLQSPIVSPSYTKSPSGAQSPHALLNPATPPRPTLDILDQSDPIYQSEASTSTVISPPSLPPTTIYEALSSIPVVSDFIHVVISVNSWLCRILPVYSTIISSIMAFVQGINMQLENIAIFQWIGFICERVILRLIEKIRRTFPAVLLPPREVLDRIWTSIKSQISLSANRVASYSWSQRALRMLESALRNSAEFLSSLTIDQSKTTTDLPWWNIRRYIRLMYQVTISRVLNYGITHVNSLHSMIRNIRRAGASIVARHLHIQNRRKASPRKSSKTEVGGPVRTLSWLANQILMRFGLAQVKSQMVLQAEGETSGAPNRDIPSEEKKRKLSDEGSSSSSSCEEEMTHHDLFRDLSGYHSESDPTYEPSEVSTDSYEYRTSQDDETEEQREEGSVSSPEKKRESELIQMDGNHSGEDFGVRKTRQSPVNNKTIVDQGKSEKEDKETENNTKDADKKSPLDKKKKK